MKNNIIYQVLHFLIYSALFAVYWFFKDKFTGQSFGPLSASGWFIFSWIAALLFHAWIVFFWRMEYHYEKISTWFGERGFTVYRAGFVILSLSSLLPLIPISYFTRGTADIHDTLKLILITVTTPLIFWAAFSVIQFFGINRAFGGDHFLQKYRDMPLEKRGTFKYIPNSMYVIILLLLYHPGLFYESFAGLLAALLHHTFVWAHYFCTERPDIKIIYGDRKDETK